MKGWEVVPSFDLPKGFSLREDTDFMYLYKGKKLLATFNSRQVTLDEILKVIR